MKFTAVFISFVTFDEDDDDDALRINSMALMH
jgi:hypothetical protein